MLANYYNLKSVVSVILLVHWGNIGSNFSAEAFLNAPKTFIYTGRYTSYKTLSILFYLHNTLVLYFQELLWDLSFTIYWQFLMKHHHGGSFCIVMKTSSQFLRKSLINQIHPLTLLRAYKPFLENAHSRKYIIYSTRGFTLSLVAKILPFDRTKSRKTYSRNRIAQKPPRSIFILNARSHL